MRIVDAQPGVNEIFFEERELDIFADTVSDLAGRLDDLDEAEALNELEQRGIALRETLPEVAQLLGDTAAHRGAKVLIIDLPLEITRDVGPTPVDYRQQADPNLYLPDLYRGILLGLAGWYGYGYTTQQNGIIHNDIIAVPEFTDTAGHSASSRHELGLHTEDASYNLGDGLNISPDHLTLHFFRNHTSIPTIVSMPNWDDLSTTARDVLSEAWYFNQTNPAQGGSQNNPAKPVSVLYGPSDDPWIRINTAKMNMDIYSEDQARALAEFKTHVEAQRLELPVAAGQIAVIDNRRVLHGRPAYKPEQRPQYDGTDRWQRRLTVSTEANRIREFESRARIVDPERVLQKAS